MTRDYDKDRELWRRAAQARRSETASPEAADPLLVAGYLDGTLDEAGREAFEARLAAEPALLDSVLSARVALAETPVAAPPDAIARAQAIVSRSALAEQPRRGTQLGGWLRPLGWAAVCALALLVTGTGFEIGRSGYDALVEYRTLMTETVAFDFSDPASDMIL